MFPTIPPRVDDALTRLGRPLLEPVRALATWAERHREELQAARDKFDANARSAQRPSGSSATRRAS